MCARLRGKVPLPPNMEDEELLELDRRLVVLELVVCLFPLTEVEDLLLVDLLDDVGLDLMTTFLLVLGALEPILSASTWTSIIPMLLRRGLLRYSANVDAASIPTEFAFVEMSVIEEVPIGRGGRAVIGNAGM